MAKFIKSQTFLINTFWEAKMSSVHSRLGRFGNFFVCLNDTDINFLVKSNEWQRFHHLCVSFDTRIPACGSAAKKWRRMTNDPSYPVLDRKISASGLRMLVSSDKILSLSFGRNRYGSYGMSLPVPQTTQIDYEMIQVLSNGLSKLESLEFCYCDIEQAAFPLLTKIRGLTSLNLINTPAPKEWHSTVRDKYPDMVVEQQAYSDAGLLEKLRD